METPPQERRGRGQRKTGKGWEKTVLKAGGVSWVPHCWEAESIEPEATFWCGSKEAVW